MHTLETQRLFLRQFRPTDIEPYAALCADPEVMRYVGEREVLSRDDAWRQMAMLAGHWQLRGFGMWAVSSSGKSSYGATACRCTHLGVRTGVAPDLRGH